MEKIYVEGIPVDVSLAGSAAIGNYKLGDEACSVSVPYWPAEKKEDVIKRVEREVAIEMECRRKCLGTKCN